MVPGTDDKPGDGFSRHVYEISKRLGEKGYDLVNVAPSVDGSFGSRVINDAYTLVKVPVTNLQAINTHVHKINSLLELASHYLHYREAVKKFMKTLNEPLLIHTHGFYTFSQPRNGSRRCKRVATLHGFMQTDILSKGQTLIKAMLLNSLLKRIYRNADMWTAISERIRSMATNLYGIDENMITVVPHGVDAKFYSARLDHRKIERVEEKFQAGQTV